MDSTSRRGKMKMDLESDRISSLPDDIIHKILSYMDIKVAIGTSVLSSRWRFIWKSMPYLNLSNENFSTLPKFSKFVTNVLSRRNNLTEVHSLKLCFRIKTSHVFVKRILDYAFSHNIQQLNVVYLVESNIELPLSLFSSQSLKHLSLTTNNNKRVSRRHFEDFYFIRLTSTWEPSTLTTLDLRCVTLVANNADKCVSVFLKCANLKKLTLKRFKTIGLNAINIFHPQLSNLTLENNHRSVKVVNVAAPQLKNLTIKSSSLEDVKISAPDLASLLYKGFRPLSLSTEGFHSLEKAHIYVSYPTHANAHQIVCLLQQLHNVKFLELNLEIVEILSSSKDLILHQPSPFVNLKSLKIYPENMYVYNHAPKKVAMSTKLKSYMLDSSPMATFTMVLREEIQAQNLMAELRVLLENGNDKSKTKRAHLEQGKTPAESHEPKKLKVGDNMAQIMKGWKNLSVQIEKARAIISKLQNIEELLTKLPASKRAKLQPCISSLHTEANIAISKIADCLKIQCDENQSRSSDC